MTKFDQMLSSQRKEEAELKRLAANQVELLELETKRLVGLINSNLVNHDISVEKDRYNRFTAYFYFKRAIIIRHKAWIYRATIELKKDGTFDHRESSRGYTQPEDN